MRYGGLLWILAVASVAVVVAMTVPEGAAAFSSAPTYQQTNLSTLYQWGTTSTPSTLPGNTTSTTAWHRFTQLMKATPKFKSLSTITLGVTAFTAGWKIGTTIRTKWTFLSGLSRWGEGSVGSYTANGGRWVWNEGCTYATVDVCTGTSSTVTGAWIYRVDLAPTANVLIARATCADTPTDCDSTTAYPAALAAQTAILSANPLAETATTDGSTNVCGGIANSSTPEYHTCRIVYLSEERMNASLQSSGWKDWETGDPANYTSTGFTPGPMPDYSSDDATDALTWIESDPTLEASLNEQLQPGYAGSTVTIDPDLIALPQPAPNETYSNYITRLRQLGWLGVATTTEYSAGPDTAAGPLQAVGIEVPTPPGQTTTTTLYRFPGIGDLTGLSDSAYPDPGLYLDPSDDIELYYNPSTADPITQTSPPPGVPGYSGQGCDPWLSTSLNLSPLYGVDLGEQFPFGLFVWVDNLLDSLTATVDAPNFTVSINIPSTPVSPAYGPWDYTIDLEGFDAWASTIRTIVAWVLWIGFVWFVATSFLGIRATSNPAEAIEEAYDL